MDDLKVGDTVALNGRGVACLWGAEAGLDHMRNLHMKITKIYSSNMVDDETRPVYLVEVDNPEINQFFIDTTLFNKVET